MQTFIWINSIFIIFIISQVLADVFWNILKHDYHVLHKLQEQLTVSAAVISAKTINQDIL